MRLLRIFLFGILLPIASHASLVARDLYAPNDALLTYDTTSNLEWLDVSATVGQSYNSVFPLLQPGGPLAGFRYASGAEVTAFITGQGITITDGAFVLTGEMAKVAALVNLWGRTGFPSDGYPGPATRGIYGDAFGTTQHLYASIGIRDLDGSTVATVGVSLGPAAFSDSATNSSIGSILVRTAVPAPPAIAALVSALGVLARRARRRTGYIE